MLIIHQNKNEEGNSRRTYTMNFDIYIERISGYLEKKRSLVEKMTSQLR